MYGLIERNDSSSSRPIVKGTDYMQFLFILSIIACSHATFIEFDFLKGFEFWNTRRNSFLKELKKVKHCFTEAKTNDIMRVINSNQCSIVGLPLEDAIRLEYDNWLSEDWFPNEKELADMKLDEVM